MTATAQVAPSIGIAGQSTPARVVSLDIFRGITMAMMIFVNDLASVHGLSKWTYHMQAKVDAMTYVDMVFPAFLFIVGMSLPLAVRARLKREPSVSRLWLHIALRSFALLVLGLILPMSVTAIGRGCTCRRTCGLSSHSRAAFCTGMYIRGLAGSSSWRCA